MIQAPLYFQSASGLCSVGWTSDGVNAFRFLGSTSLPEQAVGNAPIWVFEAVRAITKHLAGEPQGLTHIPLDLTDLTAFQRKVAVVLRSTRPGQTLTYGEVALLAGSPGAARAVGRAVKTNPILLLIPCHRVVAADGPGGWSAFGDPAIKARLLELETLHT
ncbi:MAG: MGMT family protein [Holophagaceae bacterium]|nr:MGMT family protein [Holophagaceae bacterium]